MAGSGPYGGNPLGYVDQLWLTYSGIGVLFAVLSTRAVVAQELPIKLGLWETTSTSETKGLQYPAPPAANQAEMEKAMAGMTPEQRAKMTEMRAKMAAVVKSAGQPSTSVTKSCVTKADIGDMSKFGVGEDAKGCKHTIVKSSATAREVHGECNDGNNKTSLTLSVKASNPETVISTMEMSSSGPEGPSEMKVKRTAKWLGADCGPLKH
jgi:hypothetical protein